MGFFFVSKCSKYHIHVATNTLVQNHSRGNRTVTGRQSNDMYSFFINLVFYFSQNVVNILFISKQWNQHKASLEGSKSLKADN